MSKAKIALEEVHYVAQLAHLTLTPEEEAAMQEDLNAILGYVAQLEEVDVEGVEPTTHAVALEMPRREDTVEQRLSRQQILANAPDKVDGMFRVPRSVEGGN